jgi:hypothetical protein
MRSDDPNSVLDEDELEPLYHLDESGQLTWTEEGLRTYRKRFARFGLRIEAVVTHDQLRTALQISAAGLTDQLLAIAENGPRSLERNLLVAIARNDDLEYQRLLALLKARNRLGLQVVAGLKGANSC